MKIFNKLVLVISLIFILALAGCNSEKADIYPSKNIKLIVPKSPGGGTDIVARGLVEYTKDKLDAKIIVENQPGGGGVTGMVEAANAKEDGYTLSMSTVELAILPHLGRSPVDYEDFIPIVIPIADPASLIVPADAPYDTITEFIAYAKENPGFKVGNSGIGAIWHLAAVAVEDEFDIKFTHVPYDGGSAPAVAALVGKHIDAIMVAPGNAKSQIEAGELKVIAVMSDERLESFKDVPTFKEELGMDFTVSAWAALTAPAGTPDDVIDILVKAFTETVEDPKFQEFLRKQGIDPVQYSTEEARKMMKEDHEVYGKLLEKIDL